LADNIYEKRIIVTSGEGLPGSQQYSFKEELLNLSEYFSDLLKENNSL